ncbi:MAG: SDR family oxidoreductase [Acidimicrobiia bacterium]
MLEKLRYDGKRVLVTGAASGMGAALSRMLVEAGAEVYGADVKPVTIDGVAGDVRLDLADEASIVACVDAVGGPLHSIFSVAGIPGGERFSDLLTMTVNFIGARHLIETAVERGLVHSGASIGCVTSFAGFRWERRVEKLAPLMATDGFEQAVEWCEQNKVVGYTPSKTALNVYVAWRSVDLAAQGIRLNAVAPGLTNTPLTPDFAGNMGADVFEKFPRGMGRDAEPEEQAFPLLFLNSDAASFIAGQVLYVDGALGAGLTTGKLAL